MKNKGYIFSGVLLGLLIIAMIVFVIRVNNDSPVDNTFIEGSWKVLIHYDGETITPVDNEYLVFSAGTAYFYRDSLETPIVTTSYELGNDLILELKENSKQYKVEKKTDNHIRLYDSPTSSIYLIRHLEANLSPVSFNSDDVSGKWNVVYHDTDDVITNEYLVFENDKLFAYRNNKTEPAMVFDYYWEGNQITLGGGKLIMYAYTISNDVIAFVEKDSPIYWELQKSN